MGSAFVRWINKRAPDSAVQYCFILKITESHSQLRVAFCYMRKLNFPYFNKVIFLTSLKLPAAIL